MASIISAGTTSSTSLVASGDTSGVLQLATNNGTTAVTIDASQQVGIGTTSPTAKVDVRGILKSTVASGASATFYSNTTAVNMGDVSGVPYIQGIFQSGGNSGLAFYNYSSEAMRIDSSGNLLVGTTSLGAYTTKLTLSYNSGTTNWSVGPNSGSPTNFYISANGTQGVYLNGTAATSWTAISDERAKDIIEPITEAVKKVSTLRAVIGKYKNDEQGIRRSFLIAQDIQAVLPEAVDASNPDLLGVQYTEVIPLLVAAIKELSAQVTALQSDNAALKAKVGI